MRSGIYLQLTLSDWMSACAQRLLKSDCPLLKNVSIMHESMIDR